MSIDVSNRFVVIGIHIILHFFDLGGGSGKEVVDLFDGLPWTWIYWWLAVGGWTQQYGQTIDIDDYHIKHGFLYSKTIERVCDVKME